MGESETTGATRSKTPKERLFQRRKFGTVVRVLWPDKPALNLAQRTGDTERAANHWITGRRKPSAQAIRIVINELFE